MTACTQAGIKPDDNLTFDTVKLIICKFVWQYERLSVWSQTFGSHYLHTVWYKITNIKKKKHMFWISAVDNADLKEVTVIQRHPNNVLQTT